MYSCTGNHLRQLMNQESNGFPLTEWTSDLAAGRNDKTEIRNNAEEEQLWDKGTYTAWLSERT